MERTQTRQRYQRSLAGPLLLIAIGVGLLLSNLGLLPLDFWEVFSRYWPVILIVFGLDGLYRGESWIGSPFLIGVGIVFLLSTLGYIPLDIWVIAIRYWPLLIVVWGLDVLLSRGQLGAVWRALIGLAILAVMIAGILWFSRISSTGQFVQTQKIEQPIQGAKQLNLKVSAISANLNLHPGTGSSSTLLGTINHGRSETILITYSVTNGAASYSIKDDGITVFPGSGSGIYESWDLAILPELSTNLTVNMVGGNLKVDLTGANVQSLSVDNVIGSTSVTLPTARDVSGDLAGVIGQTTLIVPRKAPLRLQLSSGLNNASYPEGYLRDGDYLFSPEARSSGHWSELKIDQLIGKITIKEKP
ncbi:MAG TPA: DUF5668 domain-containing protein [Anaerolineaceae bacterium]|nr:DUF5668 domain-containing protein [Anaerolineaceae bacterium]